MRALLGSLTAVFFLLLQPVLSFAAGDGPSCAATFESMRIDALGSIRSQSRVMSDWGFDDFIKTPYGARTWDEFTGTLVETGSLDQACGCLSARTGIDYHLLRLELDHAFKTKLAKGYRTVLDFTRDFSSNVAGPLFRKYFSGSEMDAHSWRWSVVEDYFKKGAAKVSLDHPVYPGSVELMSKVIGRPDELSRQTRTLGNDLNLGLGKTVAVKRLEISPMAGISGMSFPQLSSQSHVSLMYMHLKLAKEQGVRQLLNTGEGGPLFHIAILKGDREKLREFATRWAIETKQVESGSWDEAKITHFVNELMEQRNRLFAEFTPEDIEKAQVVAQYGSALNGIRGANNTIDYDRLAAIGDSPFVAMTQFKLKQAAKRGARIDASKVDHVVAALRGIDKSKPFSAPAINPELSTFEDVAKVVISTKMVTRKPVSLKFAVGDVQDTYELFEFLKKVDALPDHIQLDGRGVDHSPGSGNAPVGGNTSLPIREAVIAVDGILKKLGVRDRVYVEATGDVLLPIEGVERLVLGADGISGARLWMGMGLGCAQARHCANGNCPYGIAAKNGSLLAMGLDPLTIGPKGYEAAVNWYKGYVELLSETGVTDWRNLRSTHGLARQPSTLRMDLGPTQGTRQLRSVYDLERLTDLFGGVLTPDEIKRYILGE